jgi:kynureninase
VTGVDTSEARALALDAADPLAGYRARFHLPTASDGTPRVYLAGQSLGAQPVAARAAVEAQLDAWATLGVDGHFSSDGWHDLDRRLRAATARLVGAEPDEIATLDTLTVDLHLLLASFYRPGDRRTAILIDAPTFPSDRYAVESHLRLRGLDPASNLVVVRPRPGEATLRPEDVEAAIDDHRDRLALALLAGVNYATGQVQDVSRLTAAVQRSGAFALWDLAHAVGNVPVTLDAAGVDAAAWCTYKYLDGGPGSVAQVFVARRHASDPAVPRLAGWWGNEDATRFEMSETFRPERDANAWRLSNPPVLSLAPLAASLAIFDEVGMTALRAKSIALTGYLEELLDALVPDGEMITPRAPAWRGAQLSVRFDDVRARHRALEARGIVADLREPDIIRLAPVPLYNTFHDAWRAATALAASRGEAEPAGR